MANQTINQDKINFTIDLLVFMTVEELATDLNKPTEMMFTEFVESKTGKLLYNADSKLWCNGPSYIAELYKTEKGLL